jgi:hypothetical protein
MSKQRQEDLEDDGLVSKPFIEELSDWMDSPEGELWTEICDTLEDLLKDVQPDAKQRLFIWPDSERLNLEQSVCASINNIERSSVARLRSFLSTGLR